MRIALCDDEKMYSEILQSMIQQWAADQEETIKINVFESAEGFLKKMDQGVKYDLLFLDIQMGGMSGVELAKTIRQRDMNMLIVFVTSFLDYVFVGYEVAAFRFMVKPVKEKKVLEALNAAIEVCRKRSTKFFAIRKENVTFKVAKSDIVYFAKDNHYITVHTFDNTYRYRGKLTELGDEFAKPAFVLCNRGILVNVEHISSIYKDKVIMTNNEELPASRLYWDDLNRCYLAVHVAPEMARLTELMQ